MNTISVEELWEKRNEETFTLLDVREPDEIANAPYTQVKNIMTIPMNDVGSRLRELDKSKDVIVACRSGMRSATVCNVLNAQGFTTHNLTGGILAWSKLTQD